MSISPVSIGSNTANSAVSSISSKLHEKLTKPVNSSTTSLNSSTLNTVGKLGTQVNTKV
jgi:hypothetical protein